MADPEHLERIDDVEGWNQWRLAHPDEQPDLIGADLSGRNLIAANLTRADLGRASLYAATLHKTNLDGANLTGTDLRHANLNRANLTRANLTGADLSRANPWLADLTEANLTEANLTGATLVGANLSGATLTRANLKRANLTGSNLTGANLDRADLVGTVLVESVLDGVTLTGARVYGASVWNVQGVPAAQNGLLITRHDEAEITVDNLKVAQFIHLLLGNDEIRDVIDTITSKAVLILGRFSPDHKPILDILRTELRERYNYSPIVFDFDKPASRDLTETVRTLAHLSRFIVADLTDPSSIAQELQAIVPDLAVPVAPILSGHEPNSMFADLRRKYHWVLDIHRYENEQRLLATLATRVIEPAEAKAKELSEQGGHPPTRT